MDFRILGRLEVSDGERQLSLGGSKRRVALALLVVNANEVVGTDRFVDGLWGNDAPGNAIAALHNHIFRLRKELGPDVLGNEGWGYVLRVDPETIDYHRFERLVADAQRLPASERARQLAEALALWRGPPLADLTFEDGLARDLARLEERRLTVVEQRIDADLEAGRAAEQVGELEALIDENPFREHLRAQLILALYRSGRQAEALDAYRDTRRFFSDELGIEPGARLRELERAILSQDPALDKPATFAPVAGAEPEETPEGTELPTELDPTTQLFGRGRELRFLQELWRRAARGQGGVAFLRGPPGIGKTRLAAELAREVNDEDGMVVYAPCAGSPRQAIDRIRLAARSLQRILLVADDVDLASGTLIDSLAALASESPSRPLLLLCTYRDETSPFLRTLLDRIDPSRDRRCDLGPLDEDEVRSIASLYAGWSVAHLPLADLVAATNGVPGLVHHAAREWAREHNSGRLSELTSQAAADRKGLRRSERGLEESVADFQLLRTWADAEEEAQASVVCPFKGLATFEASDAEFFFGREKLVAELVARLVGARFLAVLGQSGSGKSSTVRAGLMPALADGVIPGSERWHQLLVRPGRHPLRALEDAVPDGGEEVVIVVDQLEEMFTLCDNEEERASFAAALSGPSDSQTFVVALRADFYGRCAAYPGLAELLAANQVLVGPMREDDLRRAIELPARRARLRVERELVDALVRDVVDRPGGLPLLSTALLELWQERDSRTLTVSQYRKSGGVSGAVARLAENAYQGLSENEKLVARGILRRLATSDAAGGVTRRRASLSELDADTYTDSARVVAVLTRARLLTTSEESVEVAHEALLREWPRLRAWLEEDAEGQRLHRHLIQAAREWDERGRDPAELYRGARLSAALDWTRKHLVELNETERRFVAESHDAWERESERERRTNRRLRLLLAWVVALLGGAVIAGIVAFDLRGEAKERARVAGSRELAAAAEANLGVDPERSILLALQAVKVAGGAHGAATIEAEESLQDAVAASRSMLDVPDAGRRVSLSPDGTKFVSVGKSNEASVRDATTGVQLAAFGSAVARVDYGSSGKLIATGDLYGKATIWDVATGRRLLVVRGGVQRLAGVKLGARDRVLATLDEAGVLRVWSVATGKKLLERRAWRGEMVWPAAANIVSFSGNGRRVAAADRSAGRVAARVWDLDSGRSLLEIPSAGTAVPDVDLSFDGSKIALARDDGTVEIRDVKTGRLEAAALAHEGDVWDVEFATDGSRLATAGNDGLAKVWAVGPASLRPLFVLPGHNSTVEEVSFSRDGTRLASSGDDGTARVWDVSAEGPRAALELPGSARVFSGGLDFFPDGRRLAAPSHPGRRVRVWDVSTGRAVLALDDRGETRGVSVSPDGRRIATTEGSAVHVWNAKNGARLYERVIDDACRSLFLRCPSTRAVFSPDGSLLAVGSSDGTVRILRAATGRQVLSLEGSTLEVLNVAFSPDGRRLAAAGADGTARVWDAVTWTTLLTLGPVAQATADVAFSRDGKQIVTAGWDGFVRVWDASDGAQLRAWNANQGDLFDIAVARDGRLATAGEGGRIKLWDISRGEELLSLHSASKAAVAFSPDGRRLASSVAFGRTVTVWPLALSDLVDLARSRVTRSLTREECRRYLHVDHCPGGLPSRDRLGPGERSAGAQG